MFPVNLRSPISLLLMLCAVGLFPSCGGGHGFPPGTVALVNGTPITQAEVDAQVEALLEIEPAFVITQRRRLIMTHIAIPKAYGIALAGERRERAREEAQAWLDSETPHALPEGFIPPETRGRWGDLGLGTWLVARELEVGESSGIVELCGQFAVIKMLARDRIPGREAMELEIENFPYDDQPLTLTNRCRTGTLQIIDPTWDEVIPATYKYSMRGKK